MREIALLPHSEQLSAESHMRDQLSYCLLPNIGMDVGCVYFITDGKYTKIGFTYDLPDTGHAPMREFK